MLGHLTVAQNIFIGREFKKGIKIDDKKMNEEAQKLFDRMNVDIDPRETMSKLTVGKQQMCEIAKLFHMMQRSSSLTSHQQL